MEAGRRTRTRTGTLDLPGWGSRDPRRYKTLHVSSVRRENGVGGWEKKNTLSASPTAQRSPEPQCAVRAHVWDK